MKPHIEQFDSLAWATKAARLIQNCLNRVIRDRRTCSVMLTGGRSAERLYVAWAELPSFQALTGVQFFFGDERCVSPEHRESNYGMAMRTLFHGNAVRSNNVVHRMEADAEDINSSARYYEQILPKRVDVLLLGVGEDGHIASLFPASPALQETGRRVMPIVGPKLPYGRLTITPEVIAQAGSIFVLAPGASRAAVLSKAMMYPADFGNFPASLVLNATWLLDEPLPAKIPQ